MIILKNLNFLMNFYFFQGNQNPSFVFFLKFKKKSVVGYVKIENILVKICNLRRWIFFDEALRRAELKKKNGSPKADYRKKGLFSKSKICLLNEQNEQFFQFLIFFEI